MKRKISAHHRGTYNHRNPRPSTMTIDEGEQVRRFRLMAFHIAWGSIYADVQSNAARFAKSLVYSAQPIRDHSLVSAWWEWSRGGLMSVLLDSGVEPPAKLRPVVDAYRRAMALRNEDGELVA